MTLSAHSPQLTDSIPHDERFFHQVLAGWQGDLAHFVQYGVPRLLVALVLSFIFVRIILFFVKRMHLRADGMVGNSQRAAQLRTMAAILRATTYGVTGFYLITQILAGIGVSLGPFIASAGVIGLGISFGAQSIFKDMLTGIFILIEDQYTVGDTIKIAGLTGTVEDLSLRVTKLRDSDSTVYIVPNSQITTVSNLSRDFSTGTLNVSVDAREDPRPRMSDLEYAGEQDADNICLLHRPALNMVLPERRSNETKEQHANKASLWYAQRAGLEKVCEAMFVKRRFGEPGVVKLQFTGPTTTFADWPVEAEPEQGGFF